MEYSIIQIALVFVVTFIAAIDQFDFLESLYQPIVTGAVIGLILGDLNTGLLVGGTYQLMTIGNMPIGGASSPTRQSVSPFRSLCLASSALPWSSRLCPRLCPRPITWLTTRTPRASSA